jgi:hypothetical protein
MRFYSSGASDLSAVTIKMLAIRVKNFRKINNNDIKLRAALAGAKLK